MAIAAGAIVASNVMAYNADVGDDDPALDGHTMPTAVELIEQTNREYPSLCGEIGTIALVGKESGHLRQLGFFQRVYGLPEITSARFSTCSANPIDGEAAIAFAMNEATNKDLTLILSNSDVELHKVVDDLDVDYRSGVPLMENATGDGNQMQALIFEDDELSEKPLGGPASFSIQDLMDKWLFRPQAYLERTAQ